MTNDVFGVLAKARAMAAAEKRRPVKESDFRKGILVATVSGVLSACFSFGLAVLIASTMIVGGGNSLGGAGGD